MKLLVFIVASGRLNAQRRMRVKRDHDNKLIITFVKSYTEFIIICLLFLKQCDI